MISLGFVMGICRYQRLFIGLTYPGNSKKISHRQLAIMKKLLKQQNNLLQNSQTKILDLHKK
jgi:hypothetical protein